MTAGDKKASPESDSPSIRTTELPLFKPDGYELRNAGFLHRDAVKCARLLHRAFVMGDDDELSIDGHLHNLISEASDIRFVKWRVNFVEQAER